MKNITKASIAMSALAASLVSTQASALMVEDGSAPKTVWKTKTYCLNSYGAEGAQTVYVPFCDQSKNNKVNKRPLKSNDCAEGQVAIDETINKTAGQKFTVNIAACAVENDKDIEPAQL